MKILDKACFATAEDRVEAERGVNLVVSSLQDLIYGHKTGMGMKSMTLLYEIAEDALRDAGVEP